MLKFAHYTGAVPIAGRYTPGMFTNQIQAKFREPRLLIVSDPRYDHQVCHCVCTCWEWEEGGGGGRGWVHILSLCVCVQVGGRPLLLQLLSPREESECYRYLYMYLSKSYLLPSSPLLLPTHIYAT